MNLQGLRQRQRLGLHALAQALGQAGQFDHVHAERQRAGLECVAQVGPLGPTEAGRIAHQQVALVIVIFLVTYVVPQVAGVFISNQRALPWLTVAMPALSAFVRQWGWLVAA